MNEHSFTKAVLRILPAEVHVQSMTSASMTTNGTPDRYIDLKRDLWVEFKYASHVPRAGVNLGANEKGMLTALQKRWLKRRFNAGGNAIVVLGLPSDRTRGVVLASPAEWETVVTAEVIAAGIKTAAQIAAYILERVQ